MPPKGTRTGTAKQKATSTASGKGKQKTLSGAEESADELTTYGNKQPASGSSTRTGGGKKNERSAAFQREDSPDELTMAPAETEPTKPDNETDEDPDVSQSRKSQSERGKNVALKKTKEVKTGGKRSRLIVDESELDEKEGAAQEQSTGIGRGKRKRQSPTEFWVAKSVPVLAKEKVDQSEPSVEKKIARQKGKNNTKHEEVEEEVNAPTSDEASKEEAMEAPPAKRVRKTAPSRKPKSTENAEADQKTVGDLEGQKGGAKVRRDPTNSITAFAHSSPPPEDPLEEASPEPRPVARGRGRPIKDVSNLGEDFVPVEKYQKVLAKLEELQVHYNTLKNKTVKEAEEKFTKYQESTEAQGKAHEDMITKLKFERNILRSDLAVAEKNKKDTEQQLERKSAEAQAAVKKLDAAERRIAELEDELGREKENHQTREASVERDVVRKQQEGAIQGLKAENKALKTEIEEFKSENEALKTDNATLKDEVAELATEMKLSKAKAESLQANLQAAARSQHNDRYLATLERMVRMHEEMAGVTMQSVEDGRQIVEDQDGKERTEKVLLYRCEMKGRKGTLNFNLVTPPSPEKDAEYTYVPVGSPVSANAGQQLELPEYLRDATTFHRNMTGLFYWRMCNYVQGDEE
ncbi:hypothetical protein HK104_000512 [Borealophlyctis nickersoniae]|nr:hypothetical protein HK104_000512 [Borealophlyctis nickersoniae]